jgi:DNA-directed RNA polymerase subunit beta
VFARLEKALTGKVVKSGPGIKAGEKITKAYLKSLEHSQWFEITMETDSLNAQLEHAVQQIKQYRQDMDDAFEVKKQKLISGHDLAPGV